MTTDANCCKTVVVDAVKQVCPHDSALVVHVAALPGLSLLAEIDQVLSLIQAEVNFGVVAQIVQHAEAPTGGGKAEILQQLVLQAPQVFPNPVTRQAALLALSVFSHFFAGK